MARNKGDIDKYNDQVSKQTYRLCLLGLTNQELAVAFGVSVKTIESWYKKHPTFKRACDLGRQQADAKVAESLYKRANGYSHPDVHIAVFKGEVIVTPIVKHYPPDTTAAMFWLKNRQRDKWADVWRIEHSGSIELEDVRNELSEFSDEELDLLEKLGLQSVLIAGNKNEQAQ